MSRPQIGQCGGQSARDRGERCHQVGSLERDPVGHERAVGDAGHEHAVTPRPVPIGAPLGNRAQESDVVDAVFITGGDTAAVGPSTGEGIRIGHRDAVPIGARAETGRASRSRICQALNRSEHRRAVAVQNQNPRRVRTRRGG
ncbi:hypothetical protein [Nocardia sp. NPDC046763]|uniref:hypothetical protein n=1 Tax=Nocardia sp. NPDC046763 TaxID=3155256 RepID=UPI0033DFAFB4